MTPFSAVPDETLAALGETRLIAAIRDWLGNASAPSPRGIGDDAAVLPAVPESLPAVPSKSDSPLKINRLATTDSVVWQRHFDAAVPPRAAGAKLIKRNISDIAAMGGVPTDALLALVCGGDTATAWLAEFFAGIADECCRHRIELAGGDVASAPDGFFSATLALTGFRAGAPLTRAGARAGDTLLVTGTLGNTLATGKHHAFEPRLTEGRWLADRPEVHAGMDLTDGLAKDAPALLPAGTAGIGTAIALDLAALPLARATTTVRAALTDGEDYELLIAADTAGVPALLAAWRTAFPALPLTPIGKIISTAGTAAPRLLDAATGAPLNLDGYQHFASVNSQ